MHHFDPQSKVWVYMADRAFTGEETDLVNQYLSTFAQQWTAHNQQLKAAGEVRYHRFIVLMVDETQTTASGCSIDKSVHFLKEIEKNFGVNLFNRQLVGYKDGDEVKTFELAAIDSLFEKGIITKDTLVFNNVITTKALLDSSWEAALGTTWLNRFIPEQKIIS